MLLSSMNGRVSLTFSRWALFIIYFWFGLLKLFDLSPAHPLVEALFRKTIPFMTFEYFMVWFGVFEMAIGLLFLWPKYKWILGALFAVHMVTTTIPLFILTGITWQTWGVPTLEGQYIIKNLVIIALALRILRYPEREV